MKKRSRRVRKLETVFNAVATPVFLLDAKRTVQFFNVGCEELTSWAAAEVLGVVCDYASGSDPNDVTTLAGRMAPPPDVFSGNETSVATEFVRRDGKRITRMLHFFPLRDEAGDVRSVLGVAVPLSELASAALTSPARQLHAELAALRIQLRQRFGQGTLVGQCLAMQRVFAQMRLAAESLPGVCIQGEAGSGCEHVARSIHLQSSLSNRAFVPLDCERLPAPELKQTLIRLLQAGAEKGEAGGIASLQPGTVYLANVESLPRDLQQLIVDSEVETAEQPMQLRFVASTSRDIGDLQQEDGMLHSFYFLLTAISISLPPLNEREEDLELIAQAFLEERNRNSDKQIGGLADDVRTLFRQYNWPGNLDELRQVIAEAHEACNSELIQTVDLPFRFRTGLDAQAVGPAAESQQLPLPEYLEQVEADRIRTVLEQTRYNKTKAAVLLGIPRPKLYRRMEALGIEDLEG